MTKRAPVLIGIAGGSGCGKTYLAKEVQRQAGEDKIALLSMDQYFVSDHAGANSLDINFDHPSHLNFRQLIKDIETLKTGASIHAPLYDFHKMAQASGAVEVKARPIVIVEGLFVLAEPAVRLFDLTCFLDVEADQRLLGRILRDRQERGSSLEEIVDRYQRFVRPGYQVFVAPTAQNADVVVDFTYRRAFFTQLLVQVISDYVTGGFNFAELVKHVRGENFHLGYKPESGSMPFSTDIFKLAEAYPETTFPAFPE